MGLVPLRLSTAEPPGYFSQALPAFQWGSNRHMTHTPGLLGGSVVLTSTALIGAERETVENRSSLEASSRGCLRPFIVLASPGRTRQDLMGWRPSVLLLLFEKKADGPEGPARWSAPMPASMDGLNILTLSESTASAATVRTLKAAD